MTPWRIISLLVIICLVTGPIGSMQIVPDDEDKENPTVAPPHEISSEVEYNLANMKGWFTENQGQIENSEVKYVYAASDLSIGFIESGYLIKQTNEENLTSVVKVIFEGANPVAPGGRGEHSSNPIMGLVSWQFNFVTFICLIHISIL